MKSFRKACRGEKGFTLIELLIVVVILGILASVAAVLITRFIGSGKLEAANEELHQAKLAMATAMFDGGSSTIDGAAPYTWSGATGERTCGGKDPALSVSGVFKAKYTFSSTGDVTGATLDLVAPRVNWSGIVWDTTNKCWKKA
jgi:type IV pilus assembly protein PilA